MKGVKLWAHISLTVNQNPMSLMAFLELGMCIVTLRKCPSNRNYFLRYDQILLGWVRVSDVVGNSYTRGTFPYYPMLYVNALPEFPYIKRPLGWPVSMIWRLYQGDVFGRRRNNGRSNKVDVWGRAHHAFSGRGRGGSRAFSL